MGGMETLTPPREHDAPVTSRPAVPHKPSAIVPIREIGPRYREQVARHILSLDKPDRYLRFGYHASDDQIRQYVSSIDFERDCVLGIFTRELELAAVAHLAFPAGESGGAKMAEFGVSVLPRARQRGYGSRLFERAAIHAVNAGIETLYIHALSENIAMLRIALHAGAVLERSGVESEARLALPEASFLSRLDELLGNQIGRADWLLKANASVTRELLATMQEVHVAMQNMREGARSIRYESDGS
jgi:RimJ/RimL family protein N-acetyltransferase